MSRTYRVIARAIGVVAAAGLMGALAGAATAQNVNSDPNYGEFHLQPGFTPDPGLLSLLAGGNVEASSLSSSCTGFVTTSPDMRLFWDSTGKSSATIKISAISNADTTLIVNAPDGRWYCNDDDGEDSNPSVELTPMPGRYEIWVGTYSRGETKKAVLGISEVSSF